MRQISLPAERYASYPRMIELRDRSWLCIYEADGQVVCAKSVDQGDSWKKIATVAERQPGVNMCVPSVIQLQDGSLLAMYNPRPTKDGTEHHFAIKTKKSYDKGITWRDERLLYQAGNEFKNGCWEPAAIQLPGGEIQLFFANEGVFLTSDEQNISRLKSTDNGLSWEQEPTVISFRPGFRDGMPVPLLIGDDRLAMVIEDNGVEQFKPFIIYGAVSDDTGYPVLAEGPNRVYALKHKLADSVYAGAPYLVKLKSGHTLLSYQGTEGRENQLKYADMNVFVGDSLASNFMHGTKPFPVPAKKSALWNSLMVSLDDTIVAVSATNAFGQGKSEIWMVKGRVQEERFGAQ
ncbi:sialidase family protein [Olivibacter sp. XZL3]|uniref:sialidase family protein n=1 Tax=Olivibacter sp. XZL3 TaxID=1735116 RepID=UPI00141708AD|nr:sialidase family protein [Olivibacter sp. XZL3]